MLQLLLLLCTILLVGVCSRVCAGVYARQRAALPSERTMTRLRRAASEGQLSAPAGGELPANERSQGAAAAKDAAGQRQQIPDGQVTEGPVPSMTEEGKERVEERTLREVLGARRRALAVLALNELTGEVSRALQDARTLPPAVGRVALLGGTALGLTAIATAVQNEQGGTAALWGGASVVLALVGAGVCGMYGRLARQAAERRRDHARELIRLLERRLPSA